MRGHSKSDRNRYRTKEEIEDWMSKRDPIALFEAELREFGLIDRRRVEAIREAAAQEIAEGIEFAKASPIPDPARTDARRLYRSRHDATRCRTRELSYAQAIQEAHGAGHGSRRARVPDGRGHRRLRRRLPGDGRSRRALRRGAGDGHADLASWAVAGVAVGAALTGMRPMLEFQFSDFVTLAMEQIVNQAAKIRFMLGGKVSVPMVMRLPAGSGHRRRGPAQPEPRSLVRACARASRWCSRATPHDAKGMLLAAIDDPESGDDLRAQAALQDEGPGARKATIACRSARPTSAARAAT